MRIVVLGAGTVGYSITRLLCQHRHSVTVVDANAEHARQLNETLDAKVIVGSASQSSVLFQAGVLDCDICLAVTGSDETNLVSASIAKAMGARRTLARVYSSVLRDASTFDYQRHFRVDRILSLEHLSGMDLARAIRKVGSIAIEHFARGELEVQEVLVQAGTRGTRAPLKELKVPRGVRIGSILRDGLIRIAKADDHLQGEDRITLLGPQDEVEDLRDWFQKESPPRQSVVIAGGGETGFHLARALMGRRYSVMILEADRNRCEFLANQLRHVTVVHRNATRRVDLEEERVGKADFFAACTGDDEDNIMAGVEARELGAENILAVVNRPDYGNVVGKLGIDHVVSPRVVMAKEVLGFLNTGAIISRWSVGGGNVHILEVEVVAGAPVTETTLAGLKLPPGCLVAAMMRENYARVPGADDRLREGDTVLLLVENAAEKATLALFDK